MAMAQPSTETPAFRLMRGAPRPVAFPRGVPEPVSACADFTELRWQLATDVSERHDWPNTTSTRMVHCGKRRAALTRPNMLLKLGLLRGEARQWD
eukprot:CAMPEP_0172662978 /NCGR_PEP_ID=MMETSP1074-20121228/5650_1 /TAXON_ID=2916 /ORGANISM="Ceratium fusus, Strain PA161109" /LENGTH=94 /DNA_ID=CAMNT_0013478919 /DNA_START=13 /DNA_END=297 /DNA_ORIENTATION=+